MSLRAVTGAVVQQGTGGSITQGYTDTSGTPGNATINTPSGRASFAASASTCVVTSSACTANSKVFAQMETQDSTLTSIITVVPAAGSFTVTGNAAATTGGAAKFRFLVVN
jgi:hypothetical protein